LVQPGSRLPRQGQAYTRGFPVGAHQKQIAAECGRIPGLPEKKRKRLSSFGASGVWREEDDFAAFRGHKEQVADSQDPEIQSNLAPHVVCFQDVLQETEKGVRKG
jgi:hypothetical protein